MATLYFVECVRCGWKSNGPVGREIAEAMSAHRCRICLLRDPKSRQTFTVKEIIVGSPNPKGVA